jgi:hypothetical protein
MLRTLRPQHLILFVAEYYPYIRPEAIFINHDLSLWLAERNRPQRFILN